MGGCCPPTPPTPRPRAPCRGLWGSPAGARCALGLASALPRQAALLVKRAVPPLGDRPAPAKPAGNLGLPGASRSACLDPRLTTQGPLRAACAARGGVWPPTTSPPRWQPQLPVCAPLGPAATREAGGRLPARPIGGPPMERSARGGRRALPGGPSLRNAGNRDSTPLQETGGLVPANQWAYNTVSHIEARLQLVAAWPNG